MSIELPDKERDFTKPVTRDDVHAFAGALLISTQLVEGLLSATLHVVFKDGILTEEDFVRKDQLTSGQLIRKIREKLNVEESFDELLGVFVEQRNLLVHRLVIQEWFDLETNDGLMATWKFLTVFSKNLEQIGSVLTAYRIRLDEQIGVRGEVRLKLNESGYLDYLKTKYYPFLDSTLRRKSPSNKEG